MKENDYCSLNMVPIGEVCHIQKIDMDKQINDRLLELGFVRNSLVKPMFKSMFGKTKAYYVKGSIIALREADAKNIQVILRR